MVTLTQIICKPDTMVRMHAWNPPLNYYTDDAMTVKVKQEEPMPTAAFAAHCLKVYRQQLKVPPCAAVMVCVLVL